nr:IS6 family transposase [Pigmentibacter ruber]BFD33587.1 IS6 family transposase [Pigmentibacter ruber]
MDFKWKHTDRMIIIMAIRWYVGYSLSYRQVEELLAERGIFVDHTTIHRWIVEYSPKLLKKFYKLRKRICGSWRMDETYIKVKGEWCYLYRAVDKHGQTIDIYLSKRRDTTSAKRFFQKCFRSSGIPEKVNIDKSGSNTAALKAINKDLKSEDKVLIRQNKYLNNLVEQDHRFIKKKVKPMLGFFSLKSARATLAGIELHHMLRKGQFKFKSHLPIWEQFCSLAG